MDLRIQVSDVYSHRSNEDYVVSNDLLRPATKKKQDPKDQDLAVGFNRISWVLPPRTDAVQRR